MSRRTLVTAVRQRWQAALNRQHRLPTGAVGRFIGERMARQHTPETYWTLDLLDLRPTDRVLELGFGAGSGLALAACQAHRGEVFGVDQSAAMVRAATTRNRAALRTGHIALAQADLHSLPIAGAHFDKIFSIHTFYFWERPEQLAADLARLLAPGGMLAITLATAKQSASGEWAFWPIHQRVTQVVDALNRLSVGEAQLRHGPDSRRYNNVAIVVQR